MAYKSENLDKLKKLTEDINDQEKAESEGKQQIFGSLQKICKLLDCSRINKKEIKSELTFLMSKFTNG